MQIMRDLMHSTLLISATNPHGTGTGTGFVMAVRLDDGASILILVTNKHVVNASSRIDIVATLMDRATLQPMLGRTRTFTVDEPEPAWVRHPNPDVDLVAIPLQWMFDSMEGSNALPYLNAVPFDWIVNDEMLSGLAPLSDIIMVGYPRGIYDTANNLPILRRGVIASRPDVDFDGRSEFLIDCACFPGSSGSPIFLQQFGSFVVGDGGAQMTPHLSLLGVLYAGPYYTAKGKIVTQPIPMTDSEPTVQSSVMMNLGNCVKARELRWFEGEFKRRLAAGI